MNLALALEALLGLAVAVSLVFSIWRITSDVRRIREHFDRVDQRDRARVGKPTAPPPAPAADEKIPGSLGLRR